MSHAGIRAKNHVLTWLGDLSYCKLDLNLEPESAGCPICSQRLVPIWYDGIHPVVPPDRQYEGLVDVDGWHLVETMSYSKSSPECSFEYHEIKCVNDVLESLSMSN